VELLIVLPAEVESHSDSLDDTKGVFRERFIETDWSGRSVGSDPDDLFVSSRTGGADVQPAEKLWTLLFPANGLRPRMMLLTGAVGVGKTAFLEHFFNIFMPDRLSHSSSASLVRPVVLYVDLTDNLEYITCRAAIYESLRNSINTCFPTLDTESEYAMWERKFRWDSTRVYNDAMGDETVFVSRARLVQTILHDDRIFVKEALWYLTEKNKREVIIIVDNVDQLAHKMVGRLIGVVREICANLSRICRILPMREETKSGLIRHDVVEAGVTELRLEPPDLGLVFAARARAAHTRIVASKRSVSEEIELEDSTIHNYIFYTVAAEHVQDALEVPYQLQSMPAKNAWRILRDIMQDSTRKLLRIQRRMIRFSPLFSRIVENPRSVFSNYDILEACLKGERLFQGISDPYCDVINVFSSCGGPLDFGRNRTDMLVMYYLLRECKKGGAMTQIQNRMKSLGFVENSVGNALEIFNTRGVIRSTPSGTPVVHHRVINGYLDLIKQVAFFDCVATSHLVCFEGDPIEHSVNLFQRLLDAEAEVARNVQRRSKMASHMAARSNLLSDDILNGYRGRYESEEVTSAIGIEKAKAKLSRFQKLAAR
jgi:hypothetical protein